MADFDPSLVADPVDAAPVPGAADLDLSQFADPVMDAGQSPDVSPSQIRGAIGETAARGFLESSGALGGAALGAYAGLPLGPWGVLGGGVAGLVGGYKIGEYGAESVGLRNPRDLPPELRPYGYFGETLGGSVPFAAAPYGIAATGLKFSQTPAGNLLNQIINTARTQPVRFAAVEASTALSAATAAGVSEAQFPGNEDVRIPAELVAGMVNPTKIVTGAASSVTGIFRKAYESAMPAGRETAAARTISEILSVSGEDPAVIARVIREGQALDGISPTMAQQTGSPGLIALEKHLANRSAKFGAESKQQAMESMDAIRGMIDAMTAHGTPESLRAAAEARNLYYRSLIQSRVDDAIEEAKNAARAITDDTPDARAALSVRAREIIDTAIQDARKVESELWGKIDSGASVEIGNLRQTLDEVSADLLPELKNQRVPAVVRQFVDRVSSPRKGQESLIILPENVARGKLPESVGTNFNEMRQLRSELLDMARAANTQGDYGQARILNNLAEAVLDDIDVAFREANNPLYNEARAFSKEFNDTFTRSFVGRITAQGKYGDRVAPELTLSRAVASGKESAAVQLAEIEEATRFLTTRGFADDSAYEVMVEAQQRFLRLGAAEAIGADGRVNPEKIRTFIRNNKILMDRFPEVRESLQSALTSESAARNMESLAKGQIRFIEQQKLFAKVADRDPIMSARSALISFDQEKQITDLARIVKDRGGKVPNLDPTEAMAGLRVSLLAAAQGQATRNGVMQPDVLRDVLFKPILPGRKAPIQVMSEQGIVSGDDVENMRKLLGLAENIALAGRPGATAIDVRMDVTDYAMSLVGKIVGSKLVISGSQAAGGSAHSLIAAGAGARMGDAIMTKVPAQSAERVLIAAMNDPELMQRLLQKASKMDVKQQAEQARYINAWLIQSGLTGLIGTLDYMTEVQQ